METKGNAGTAPSTASAYLDPQYWDERFASEEHYEWFKGYSHFSHLLRPYLGSGQAVLEFGCGNSRLCEELFKDGVRDITCIDLSPVAVERLRQRLLDGGFQGIKVQEADMLNLPFGDESFDVVIEKGTMDVCFVDSGDPWNPNPQTVNKVMAVLEGVHRVLKPEGVFISISFGQPHFRSPIYKAPGFTWSVEWKTFGEGLHYFFYILKKGKKTCDSNGFCSERSILPSINLFHEELENEDYIFRTFIDELEV